MDFCYFKNSPIHKIPFDTKLNNLLRFKLIVNEITSSLIHSNFDQIYFSLSPFIQGVFIKADKLWVGLATRRRSLFSGEVKVGRFQMIKREKRKTNLPESRKKQGPSIKKWTQKIWCMYPVESYLEEEMATHSSILAWRIPQTEESGGLQSMGPQTVRHDQNDLACMHVC